MAFITFLFPKIPRNHPARGYISTNLIANILGLGWACTPAGLKAMEELARLEAERGNPEYLSDAVFGRKERKASKEMCDFLILFEEIVFSGFQIKAGVGSDQLFLI